MEAREILKQSIHDHQDAIDKAKKELAELDKPKLRHGDYGLWDCYPEEYVAIKTKGGLSWFSGASFLSHPETDCGVVDYNNLHHFTRLGNIFDELKRYREELTRTPYLHGQNGGATINANLMPYGIDIYVNHNGSTRVELPTNKAIEFRQQLGQLIATKLKESK